MGRLGPVGHPFFFSAISVFSPVLRKTSGSPPPCARSSRCGSGETVDVGPLPGPVQYIREHPGRELFSICRSQFGASKKSAYHRAHTGHTEENGEGLEGICTESVKSVQSADHHCCSPCRHPGFSYMEKKSALKSGATIVSSLPGRRGLAPTASAISRAASLKARAAQFASPFLFSPCPLCLCGESPLFPSSIR